MANRSLNKVMLIGNLTRDPELRYTPSGTAVCTFGLATNRRWNDPEGNLQESTEFHRIVAWAKLAELCSQLLFKGRKAYVGGRLQTREWMTQDGTKRITTEIVIDTMLVLDSRMREEVPEEIKVKPAAAPAPAAAKAKPDTGKKKKPSDAGKPEEKKEEKEKEKEVKAEDIPF